MTYWQAANLIAWAVMVIYMAPGGWAALTGRYRRGDPMRLVCVFTGLVVVGFSLRWLIDPDNLAVWKALYAISILNAGYIIWVGRAYGRGPRV